MFEVSVKTRFSAAHRLEGYPGSCANYHGHNWDVEVYVRGAELNTMGILVDFRDLKAATGEVIERLDHADLSALEAFKSMNPTSENIAKYIYDAVASQLASETCHVHRVTVWETPASRASYWCDSACPVTESSS